jgi:hypothetical protein
LDGGRNSTPRDDKNGSSLRLDEMPERIRFDGVALSCV